MSRSKRRDNVCNSLRNVVEKLREISGSLEEIEEIKDIEDRESAIQKINEARTLIEELDFGELENLKDEMESWASGMEGTNFEYTSRYETVSEAANILGDIVSNLESISAPEIDIVNLDVESISNFANDVKDTADDIENTVDDAEGVEFPGMCG